MSDENTQAKASLKNRLKANFQGANKNFYIVGVLVVGGVIAWTMTGGSEPTIIESPSVVARPPMTGGVQNTAGITPDYRNEVKADDAKVINQAKESGKSAIATILPEDNDATKLPKMMDVDLQSPPPEVVRPVRAPAPAPIAPPEPIVRPVPVAQPQLVQVQQSRPVQGNPDEAFMRRLDAYQKALGLLQTGTPRSVPPSVHVYAAQDIQMASSQPRAAAPTNTVPLNVPTAASAEAGFNFTPPLTGTIVYAELIGEANSDAPGPLLVRLLDGEYAGSKAICSFKTARLGLVVECSTLSIETLPDGTPVKKSFPIAAVAVDTQHLGSAIATDIDRHIFENVAFSFAQTFAEGLSEVIRESGTIVIENDDGGVRTQNPALSTREKLAVAGGEGLAETGDILRKAYGDRPATYKAVKGTPIGLLFL